VARGQAVLEVETDKALFTVEATGHGYLHRGPYREGEVVPVLTVVALIGQPTDQFVAAEAGPPAPPPEETPALAPQSAETPAAPERLFASPRARRLAAAQGIDLAQVTPTGGGGHRVVERDVQAWAQSPKATPLARKVAAAAGVDLRRLTGSGRGGTITRADVAAAQAPPAEPPADVLERRPFQGVRALIAERMATSVHTGARVTLLMEVDATEFVAARVRLKHKVEKEWGFAPSYNDLMARCVARALRRFPYMNARLAADAIEVLAHVNLGLAVDTERGLLVPVIRDADRKGLRQFGAEFRAMVARARQGRATLADLSGGTFTLTNLGMYDVDAFTPVINLPEVAILGLGRITPKPVARDEQVVIRQMWTLSLAFDHRLVDGGPAARFLQYLKSLVEEPYLLLAE
jgi:pyruvate dehydrogenase E2 component (dihydrolipoamide acetyltransferase)